ncbi:DUF6492 family protein [Aureimonas pseudogalii]|uniref:Uncharacterized protein n=1 Tax=Aureimonas pseudogalii TaxID=1744844 RepID=A0A7W6E937_9HYPH|nr:DUF6492 family protein [Aureimonas pseudogalii]MBB3997026.1 hypothetical protein [Aureimonas pseudogalii]
MSLQVALVTSSYRGDLERCRLLCDSIDRFATGFSRHYLLVEAADVALFRSFEGPHRRVVSERDLLPGWLRPVPDPLRRGRRLWFSPFGPPLRGWHVQQLRRIAMAAAMEEDVLVSLDSDVVFVRPFDAASLHDGTAVHFTRIPEARRPVLPHLRAVHDSWEARAAALLGIAETGRRIEFGYIATLIAWRRDTVREMLARIEAVRGRSAMRALAGSRALSECTIYGRFVDEVEGRPDRHVAVANELCAVYWDGPPMGSAELARYLGALEPRQVAVGLQSFTGTDPALIRAAVGLSSGAS